MTSQTIRCVVLKERKKARQVKKEKREREREIVKTVKILNKQVKSSMRKRQVKQEH